MRCGGTRPSTVSRSTWGRRDPFFGLPVVAAAADRGYLVTQGGSGDQNGPIVIHRWSVGAWPDHQVTGLGATTLASRGELPVIAAAGATVVVAWTNHATGVPQLKVRVSRDRGATWGPTGLLDGGTDTFMLARSVAIAGQRIAVAYGIGSKFGAPKDRVASTATDFASFTVRDLFEAGDDLVLGFVSVGGSPTLAAARDSGDRIRFLRRDP